MNRPARYLCATLAALALTPSTAHAATRTDVANEARAITAHLTACHHPPAAITLAYAQARKGVQVVQMTTALPYVPRPTETDLAALVARVLPAPRTTNARLLATGLGALTDAQTTLETQAVCP
jgi:hypothetical protein